MGDTIQVNDDGLQDLANRCDTAAVAITTAIGSPSVGPPFQATTAAVTHGHARVQAAAAALGTQAKLIGTKLRIAAASYIATDVESAQAISVVGRSVEA
jgi:hypothetical protein